MIGFPAAGIAHFHNMRDIHVDLVHQQKMAQEDLLVAERIARRKQGQTTGREMDNDILGITIVEPVPTGEEAARPVVLRGQDLVNRLLRIVLDYAIINPDGTVRPRDLLDNRARISARLQMADGFDFQTKNGINAFWELAMDNKVGIARVWFGAMSTIIFLRYERLKAQGIDPPKADWEKNFLKRPQ